MWECKISVEACSLLRHKDNIIAPVWLSNTIQVISSQSGKLVKTVTLPEHIKCCSIKHLTETELVLSAEDGLYMLDVDTLNVKYKLFDGRFGEGLYINNGEVIALRRDSNEVVQLVCLLGSRIVEYNIIKVQGGGKFGWGDTVIKYNDKLYVGGWGSNKVHVYNSVTGAVLNVYAVKHPIILSVDTQGAVICCQGWDTKCISVLGTSGQWSYKVIDKIQCGGYIRAADITDKQLYICTGHHILCVTLQ